MHDDLALQLRMNDDLALRLAIAQATLATIAEYATELGRATGDWSVASPVLEMIADSEAAPNAAAAELLKRNELLVRHECDPRTPIARVIAEVVQVRMQGQQGAKLQWVTSVWQLSVVGAPYGIFVRFCPFCGVELP